MPVSKQLIVDVIVSVIVCLPVVFLQTMGKPRLSGFWCQDKSLSLPYKADTISQYLLLTVTIGLPFLVISATETMRAALNSQQSLRFRPEMWSLVKAYSLFMLGMSVNVIFTEVTKLTVGRLRPHFFQVCRPTFSGLNCSSHLEGPDRYVEKYECNNTQVGRNLLHDVHLSFPSGHASLSVYSALYTILYLQLRMELRCSVLLRPALQACALLAALYCCLTRVSDHKHFPTDVIAGGFLGAAVALAVFFQVARQVIPSSNIPGRLPRTISVDSEPRTPTPLLRPDKIVIDHDYKNNSLTSSSTSHTKVYQEKMVSNHNFERTS